MKLLLILTALLIGLSAFGQSTWRNFFTTNQNPIVEVVAGSNATVQASTVGVNLRRFTVNSTASGGSQTNISWTGVTNLQSAQVPLSVITNALNLTNWALVPTNYVPPQATHATNADFANFATNATTAGFVTNAVLTNQVYGTNIINTALTVATLPTPPANQFPFIWASDVVTSRGTGDFCYYDGTSWRTRENVVASANKTNYMINAMQVGLATSSPLTYSVYQDRFNDGASIQNLLFGFSTGTGANPFSLDSIAGTDFVTLTTGSTSSGAASQYGQWYTPNTGEMIGVSSAIQVITLSDTSETYWYLSGVAGNQIAAYPTDGIFFLYDQGETNETVGSNLTYKCVVRSGSSSQVTDSGLTVSTSGFVKLGIIITGSASATFLTNNVICSVQNTSLPTARMSTKLAITKTVNGTARTLRLDGWQFHHRYASDRSVF